MDLGLFPIVSILALAAIIPLREPLNVDKPENNARSYTLIFPSMAAFFVSIMLIWQVALIRHQFSSSSVLAIMPESLQWLLKTTRLAQSWSMFSPAPPEKDGWFILEYLDTSNGNAVDLLNRKAPLNWKKTSLNGGVLDSDRWKEWFNKIHTRSLSWDRTVDYFQKEHTSTSLSVKQQHEIQLRLWFLEESALNPERPPTRHLLFERLLPVSTSDRR